MGNIGKLTTFSRLIAEESVIMIPKVQRDYAYGRQEEKVQDVLKGLLSTMFDAVRTKTAVILDFVYGSTFVKRNDECSGLIPLDGQQRLTTLFLLFYYASIVQPGVSADEIENLKKFRYETRQSATDFIEALIGPIRDVITQKYDDRQYIKAIIEDHPKFLPSYASDPTIISMLNVLDVIESMYRQDKIENLWTKLNDDDTIQFYSLSLHKFGLTDDLYIKMNSRGKKLTPFEIFKSDLEKAINKISTRLKDELSKKIDNAWMNMLWSYAQTCASGNEKVKRADEGFMYLFNNIFRIEMFRRELVTKDKRNPSIDEIITDEEAISNVIAFLDFMSSINESVTGVNGYWNNYFYFSDEYVGIEDKIRLFWDKEANRKPIFYLAMEKELTVPELVYLYALYLLYKNHKDRDVTFKCMRIIRNLVTANVRANSAKYDMLSGFMKDVSLIINNDGAIVEDKSTFVSTAWTEEKTKADKFSDDDYKRLLKYENHAILQGSLMLFICKYEKIDELFKLLDKFERIFNNETHNNYNTLRVNLIDKEIEYAQSDANETDITRRYFIHREKDFSTFFIKNERRKNQEAILDIVNDKLTSAASLLPPDKKCLEFGVDSWQYYMIKYLSANREDTSYGCYAWDDKIKRPLEIIILNSSYHSIYNIEWKMLNHILFSEIRDDNETYSLDNHASRPVVLNKLGISLTITQNGWQMICNNADVITALQSKPQYVITCNESSDSGEFLVNMSAKDSSMDYIELAKQLIADIEAISREN